MDRTLENSGRVKRVSFTRVCVYARLVSARLGEIRSALGAVRCVNEQSGVLGEQSGRFHLSAEYADL